MLQTLTLNEEESVGFEGGHKGKIIGMGTIGNSLIFVLWLVSGVKHNMLSISQFCDSGYEVLFNKNFCSVINESNKSILFKVRGREMFIRLIFVNKLIIR